MCKHPQCTMACGQHIGHEGCNLIVTEKEKPAEEKKKKEIKTIR